jgi:pyruvate dehydrogenase (quinone)/pyruvate oxidase
MVGTSFPYIEFYPKAGQARAIQIELDPARIGLRYPIEVGLVGDSRQTIQALLPLLERKPDRRFFWRRLSMGRRRGGISWKNAAFVRTPR